MVKEENGKYQCEECKLFYRDREWAEKCEIWCKENKSCNIEITNHAENKVRLGGGK